MILTRNDIKLGIVLGIITPLLGIAIYYYMRFSLYSWADYFTALKQNKPLVTGLSTICLLCNVAIITFYLNAKKDNTAKGIFAVSILYFIAVMAFKFWG